MTGVALIVCVVGIFVGALIGFGLGLAWFKDTSTFCRCKRPVATYNVRGQFSSFGLCTHCGRQVEETNKALPEPCSIAIVQVDATATGMPYEARVRGKMRVHRTFPEALTESVLDAVRSGFDDIRFHLPQKCRSGAA